MAAINSVRYHVLRDTTDTRQLDDDSHVSPERNRDLYENRVAFTSLLLHPDGKLYCGGTAYNHDIFWRFDPAGQNFTSLGYEHVAEKFEVKIHRSLCLASDGTIYGASACLYTLDERLEAPGGAIFRFDPGSGKIEKLAIPIPRDYIQTITLDERRGLIYGMTYPVFKFFVYHLDGGQVDDYDYVGSITHISALDDTGCFWGTWDWSKHALFKYDPDTRRITYFPRGTPDAAKDANIMYPGAGPVDCMINGRDGYLYIGTTGGALCRLDPATAEITSLGRPADTRRLPGIVILDERRLLLAGGDRAGGYLAVYDRQAGEFEHLGAIADTKTGRKLYRVHDLAVTADNRTAYVAETDVPDRSGYLWQCELDLG